VDDDQVLFLREHEERLQAHLLTLSTGELVRVTDAPHLVMDVQPVGDGQLAFLNRDGFNFSLDRAPLTPIAEAAPQAVAVSAPAPAAPAEPPAPPAAPVEPPPTDVEASAPAAPETAAPPETPPSEPATPAGEGFAEFPGTPTPSDPATGEPSPEAPASTPPSDAEPASSPPASTPGPVAEAPVAEPPPLTDPEVEVLSDEPYSPLERLAYPELRIPLVLAYVEEETDELRVQGFVSLAGQDRLGFHAWAINASYDSGTQNPNISLSYGNAQLAPWYVLTTVGYAKDKDSRNMQASLSASRSFWTTPVSFGLFGLRRLYNRPEDDGRPVRTTLLGPEVSTAYFAGTGTAYGGTQKGLGLSLSAGVFPRAFETRSTMGDVRVGVDTFLGGLPFLKRDNLHLSLAGRFLPGAPESLLEVGGITAGSPLYVSEPGRGPTIPRQFQPGTAFSEYLRGYEDFSVLARHAVIGNALYRYRFIVDYGWASTLYLLPSLFVNQFEVEGFGSWARTDFRDNLRAAGGAARLQLTLGGLLPLGLYYQFAQRFDRGLGPLHLIGLSF
jgi:hypothetical protein